MAAGARPSVGLSAGFLLRIKAAPEASNAMSIDVAGGTTGFAA